MADLLADGRSVLLVGPEGIGKTAVVGAVAREGVSVLDPFEHVGPQMASDLRRRLDRGAVFLAASRTSHPRQLGAVGRILWRFTVVRVRELPDSVVRRIVSAQVEAADIELDRAWLRRAVVLARGRPGFACAMGRFARQWHAARGHLPLPALAFAATREDSVIEALRAGTATPKRKGRRSTGNERGRQV